LRGQATSLAALGVTTGLAEVAAAVLDRLEPVWDALQEGDRAGVLAEWTRWGAHWGEWVTVRTPSGPVSGTALRLDDEGGLVLRTAEGPERIVLAGDLSPSTEGSDAA
jgi:BirA family biotin operon repressor/biotin-[acetyl-CoA-carboxylase] ligase